MACCAKNRTHPIRVANHGMSFVQEHIPKVPVEWYRDLEQTTGIL